MISLSREPPENFWPRGCAHEPVPLECDKGPACGHVPEKLDLPGPRVCWGTLASPVHPGSAQGQGRPHRRGSGDDPHSFHFRPNHGHGFRRHRPACGRGPLAIVYTPAVKPDHPVFPNGPSHPVGVRADHGFCLDPECPARTRLAAPWQRPGFWNDLRHPPVLYDLVPEIHADGPSAGRRPGLGEPMGKEPPRADFFPPDTLLDHGHIPGLCTVCNSHGPLLRHRLEGYRPRPLWQ